MSFLLYNQSAFDYEKKTIPVTLNDDSLTPQDYQELEYRLWKQQESLKPDDYDFYALPQSTVNLLLAEIDIFTFPHSGLEGVEKAKLIEAIDDFKEELSHSCWHLKSRLTKLIKFLNRHNKIYHY